ncbi:Endoplasmic reticulum-Golgi intermediate compartment protein 2 [Manis javanica]|nr:Endoplasmic reticulum-Golgi intermediate compartment protein 2 [Manis javanica]
MLSIHTVFLISDDHLLTESVSPRETQHISTFFANLFFGYHHSLQPREDNEMRSPRCHRVYTAVWGKETEGGTHLLVAGTAQKISADKKTPASHDSISAYQPCFGLDPDRS